MKNLGAKAADIVASVVGSWKFILIQSGILFLWIYWNLSHKSFDPYPFILLNLALSFQAAFTAPIIMMAQNRADAKDRKKVDKDYHVNLKAEEEIMLLHHKIDLLKEREMKELIEIIKNLRGMSP